MYATSVQQSLYNNCKSRGLQKGLGNYMEMVVVQGASLLDKVHNFSYKLLQISFSITFELHLSHFSKFQHFFSKKII
jgi:hypothetical protein